MGGWNRITNEIKMWESNEGQILCIFGQLYENINNPFAIKYVNKNWKGCLAYIASQPPTDECFDMMLEFILSKGLVDVNDPEALFVAVRHDNCLIVDRLLQAGVNAHLNDGIHNALTLAIKNNSLQMFTLFLERGCDFNFKNESGRMDASRTVMEELFFLGDSVLSAHMIQMLLDRSARMTSHTLHLFLAYWDLSNESTLSILKQILDSGQVDVNELTPGLGSTPGFTCLDIVHERYLQNTAFFSALYWPIASLLLRNGARLNNKRPCMEDDCTAFYDRIYTLLTLSRATSLPRFRNNNGLNKDMVWSLDSFLFKWSPAPPTVSNTHQPIIG